MAEQKLNIVFTGDVSQLTKAIQSAEAELTSFENKLKDSLGTEAFASVNQAVDQLRQKFKTLSSIDIKANPQQALTAINEVLTGVAKIKSSEVFLKANNKDALAAVNQLESFVNNIKGTIVVGIDKSGITAEIEQIKKEIESIESLKIEPDVSPAQLNLFDKNIDQLKVKLAELEKIRVSFDTSGIGSVIESIKSKFLSVFEIDIAADPAGALAAIDVIQGEIDKVRENKLLLDADNGPALAALNKLQSELNDLRATIKIDPAAFDISKLKALLAPISQRVELNLNTRVAEAEIRTLLEQVRSLKNQGVVVTVDGRQAVATIEEIEKELLQLQASLKTATDPKEILKLNQALLTLRNSISGTGSSQFAGNLNRAKNATFAFSQVLREAPAFAFSLQTGLLGISNNLPILADRFKEARASGLSVGAIFKDMAKGLIGLPGIMTIVSTAAIFLAGAFTKSSKASKLAEEDINDFSAALDEAASSFASTATKALSLVSALSGSNLNLNERKKALEELKEINQEFFGSLKEEDGLIKNLQVAYDGYIQRLKEIGKTKAIESQLTKLFDKKLQLELSLDPKFISQTDLSVQKVLGRLQKELQSLGGPVDVAKEKFDAFNKTQAERLRLQTKISQLQQGAQLKFLGGENFNQRTKEIQQINLQIEALSGILKEDGAFSLELDIKDPKDQTDEIIARARAFVKQFGDVFQTPDLEESFTNTKDKILKSALKLFDDLARGRLKIKLPVQVITEADLLPEGGTGNPIPKEKIDELQKAYFDQLQKEFQEPFKVDLTIAPQVEVEKAKERFRKAIQDGRFDEALDEIRIEKGTDANGIPIFEELTEQTKTMARTINETLTPAFQSFFDALIEGKNPIKAFFDSIVQSINQVIKKLIQAAIQAAILSAISGGSASFGGLFKGLLGLGSVASPGGGGFIGGVGGSTAGGTLTARVSGTDLLFVLNQGQNIVGRSG